MWLTANTNLYTLIFRDKMSGS